MRYKIFGRAVLTGALVLGGAGAAMAQSVTVERLDGDPSTPAVMDPIVSRGTFDAVGAGGGDNINGPSVIRVPEWIPASERAHPNANYYMYFANHRGNYIRMAWAKTLTGPWMLFNAGTAADRAWGTENHDGTRTPGNGVLDLDLDDYLNSSADDEPMRIHIDGPAHNRYAIIDEVASPDVLVDEVNQRIVMYFHANSFGSSTGNAEDDAGRPLANQNTFVSTSKYGLNFNHADQADPADPAGIREAALGQFYFRVFEVQGESNGEAVSQSFAFANRGFLYKAPTFTSGGDNATMANGDAAGGLWNPTTHDRAWWTRVPQGDNPLHGIGIAPSIDARTRDAEGGDDVRNVGEQTNAETPRHFAVHHDPAEDPDTIYVFYTSRGDRPESIVLARFSLAGLNGEQRLDPASWLLVDETEELVLSPEHDWEGAGNPPAFSENGSETGANELRDPYVFVDADGSLYLLYTGAGEEAIGIARLAILR